MRFAMQNMLATQHQFLAAKAMLDEETQNDESFYPSEETMKKMEVYDNLGPEMLGMYNDLYLQFKMYRK